MRSLLLCTLISFFSLSATANKYITPGTGVKYTMDDLVANSSGRVTLTSGEYFVNDTIIINTNDTLSITTDIVVKYAVGTYLGVRENGVLLIDPPNNVTFTAQNLTSGYLGIRLDTSNATVIRKLTFEYATSLRINDCNPVLDSCTLQFNNHPSSTSFGNGAVALFRSSPLIKNCKFIQNKRAAIQGGANIANAPKIFNNYFFENVTSNSNLPQINLGATGTGSDTTKIVGNTIIGGNTNSGAIGFLPIGSVYAYINGNIIRKNRYGIALNGGSNINAVISYNIIDTNNIQGDPNLGGSGIAFSGGSASSQQNSIVTGNIFRANLWGITIQGRSKPNLGNISNADTTDDGKNQFINNTNSSITLADLYNNTVDNIDAQNNYWNTDIVSEAEDRIFHQPDDATLGLVNYQPILTSTTLPVRFILFMVQPKNKIVSVQWQTALEENTVFFNVQRSFDGRSFNTIAKVHATGSNSTYLYNDGIENITANKLYYRIQAVDADGKATYTNIREAILNNKVFSVFPNPAKDQLYIQAKDIRQIKISDVSGKLVMVHTVANTTAPVDISILNKGYYIVTATDEAGKTYSCALMVE